MGEEWGGRNGGGVGEESLLFCVVVHISWKLQGAKLDELSKMQRGGERRGNGMGGKRE